MPWLASLAFHTCVSPSFVISGYKTGLLLGAGVVLLLGINFAFDRRDEAAGCDLGDHVWDCSVRYITKEFPTLGKLTKSDRDAWMNVQKDACIEHHIAIAPSAPSEEIAVYCGCYAKDFIELLTPRRLSYLEHTSELPPDMKHELDVRTPECARLANSVNSQMPRNQTR